MPHELFRTRIRRRLAKKNTGVQNKRKKQNQGSTVSFPLEGEIKASRYGRPIEAKEISLPDSKK